MRKSINEHSISDEVKESLERVYLKVINLLSGASKSQKEIERKLTQYLYKEKLESKEKEDIKESIITRLKELKHYDDKKFTKEFVENLMLSSKPRSKKEISRKLFSKGVDIKIIESVLLGIGSSQEKKAATRYFEKAIKKYKTPLSFKDKNKLIKQILSKGYDFQIAKSLVDSIDSVK
jgi:regulatory protein